MPAVRGRQQSTIQVTAIQIWEERDGIQAILAVRRIRLVRRSLMRGACMTCTAMYGNGARTGIITATTGLQLTAAPGFHLRVNTVFCGAGRGTATRTTAVPPIASCTILTTVTSATVFVWRAVFDAVF